MKHEFGLVNVYEEGVIIIGCETCNVPLVTLSVDPADGNGPDFVHGLSGSTSVGDVLRNHAKGGRNA